MNSPVASPIHLYIVEDSPVMRSRYSSELQGMVHLEIVGQAGTVSEAIAGIQKTAPGIVLLDLTLEDGSGLEVLRALSTAVVKPQFVVVTNNADAANRDLCIRLGATHFFDKSNQFLELLDFLESLKLT
jgi:two-component system OmpR family response regulator